MTKLNHIKAKWDIARFFCYALLTSCLFSRGVFMLYLTHKGLTVAQVGLYQMLVQLSMFLLEVPTGSVGDKVGKVHSLQIGTLLLLLHCVFMMALQQPAALVALGFLEGMGYTFSSGSDDALFYELLKKNHQEQDYLQLNARLKSAQSILTGATISAGAFIVSWSWEAVYGITALCLGSALLVLTPLREPAISKPLPTVGGKGAFSRLRQRILYPNLTAFLLCVIGFSFMDGISGSYYNYNQIIFQQAQIPVALIGIFFSANYFAASAAYLFATWLSRWLSKRIILSCMIALQGALFASLAFTRQPVLFVAFAFICCLTPEVVYILADSIIQTYIASEYRATILSAVSMLRSLMSAVSYSVLGGILDRTGTTGFMLFLALVCIAALGCFRLIPTYRQKSQDKSA